MYILNMCPELREKAYEFLKNVIKNISDKDDQILNKASLLIDEEKICGIMSYEKFHNIALIRYFVFKTAIKDEEVRLLLSSIEEKAKKDEIDTLMGIVKTLEVENMFKILEFKEIDKGKVYIDEICLLYTEYNDSKIYVKYI